MKHHSILLIIILLAINFTQSVKSQSLSGPYLGQKPPDKIPELFAPEIFSFYTDPDSVHTFSTAFTPCGNEIYFSRYDPDKKMDQIMFTRKLNNVWTQPMVASFSGTHNENDVRITTDGYRMFFRSRRALPDFKKEPDHFYIWYVTREENGSWSEMKPLKCGGEYLRSGDIGISNNGTLYFAHIVGDSVAVYKSRFIHGAYSKPEFVIIVEGYPNSVGDTFIAPDESYLIVSCWDLPENRGKSDLYISFQQKDGTWTPLKNMGSPINTEGNENCSTLSPDGKYFFYLSCGKITGHTYWVESTIIENLK